MAGLLMVIVESWETMSAMLSVGVVRGTVRRRLTGLTIALWTGRGICVAAAEERIAAEQIETGSREMEARCLYIMMYVNVFPMKKKEKKKEEKVGKGRATSTHDFVLSLGVPDFGMTLTCLTSMILGKDSEPRERGITDVSMLRGKRLNKVQEIVRMIPQLLSPMCKDPSHLQCALWRQLIQ